MTHTLLTCLVSLALAGLMCGVEASFEIRPDIPVPTAPYGIRYLPATPRPKVILEIILEVHCSDSERQWAIIKQVQEHYGNDKLDVVMQNMVLPYHRNAFLGTQGLFLIQNSSVSIKVFDYLEESFKMALNYSTAATVDMTETQVLDMMGDMANRVTGIDKIEFTSNINNYIAYTRAAWKFAVKRDVAVTPTFFVNGVELGIGTGAPSFNDWVTFLDPIIGD